MYLYIKKNTTKILLFIIFSFLFAAPIFSVHAASLSLSPASGNFETGEKVVLKVLANSDVPFNAVSGLLSVPSIFSIESISKISSVLDFWVTEPIVSKTNGTVKFEGVSLGGFPGSKGTVITINLRASKVGIGNVVFNSGQILANDGQGTDITGNLASATYSVKEAVSKPVPPAPTPVVEPIPVVETPQPAPTLKAPEILLGTKYGAPSIVGSSEYPGSQVLITFVSQQGIKIFILGSTEADGSFNVLVPSSLKYGAYTVTAMMIKQDKTSSDPSNTIVIVVGNIFSDVGWQIWLAIVLFILSILYLLIRIYFHLKKDKNKNDFVDKNKLLKAESTIHRSFDSLRDDVASRSQGVISSVERANIEELKKDVDSTEKIITKEIENLEK